MQQIVLRISRELREAGIKIFEIEVLVQDENRTRRLVEHRPEFPEFSIGFCQGLADFQDVVFFRDIHGKGY
jgi:hypothetical protein